jgi:hypothetical protein
MAPLYNSYVDVYTAAARLHEVVAQGVYKKYPSERPVVT